MHAARDIRVEDREVPHVIEPTDAVVKLEAACVCGSDLWPYRGIQPLEKARPMGHEYVGTVVEAGVDLLVIRGSVVSAKHVSSGNLQFQLYQYLLNHKECLYLYSNVNL